MKFQGEVMPNHGLLCRSSQSISPDMCIKIVRGKPEGGRTSLQNAMWTIVRRNGDMETELGLPAIRSLLHFASRKGLQDLSGMIGINTTIVWKSTFIYNPLAKKLLLVFKEKEVEAKTSNEDVPLRGVTTAGSAGVGTNHPANKASVLIAKMQTSQLYSSLYFTINPKGESTKSLIELMQVEGYSAKILFKMESEAAKLAHGPHVHTYESFASTVFAQMR
eukprot:scaffold1521_cov271-Chaetoceros_neogracile.AAC.70